jgi:OOP family OmpA-OmpF porin
VGTPPPLPPPPPPPPPPKEPEIVKVTDKAIVIGEKVQFDVNKATIKEVSHKLLDTVAEVMQKHQRLKKILVEGHASSDGNAATNLKLSDDRAKSVMKYLVGKGVDAKRLEAKGFGDTRPIADNKTEEGREKNRRVEFNILEQDKQEK